MSTFSKFKRKRAKPHATPEKSEVAYAMKHHTALRWFAVVSMLAIISWLLNDLVGPIPKYQHTHHSAAEVSSPEFQRELQALARSAPESHTGAVAVARGG